MRSWNVYALRPLRIALGETICALSRLRRRAAVRPSSFATSRGEKTSVTGSCVFGGGGSVVVRVPPPFACARGASACWILPPPGPNAT